MSDIIPSIACNLDTSILSAAFPLLEESRVGAIEWAFDTLYGVSELPGWFSELLEAYGHEQRLIGHGVFFSLFSGRWRPEQQDWLDHLRRISRRYRFDHITEHFGFMTGKDFHHGAPMNIPFSASTLRIGQDRLQRIYEASECPVGLENLAFAYSPEEVRRHGAFLEALIAPINGFIILDLHNLYCQLSNFDISYEELIALYPLERVREIHISGGSWETGMEGAREQIRRDTHDDAVPAEVFALLERTMGKCPNCKYVVLEQLGSGLQTAESQKAYYDDFIKMESIVAAHNAVRKAETIYDFLPRVLVTGVPVAEDETLYAQQLRLSAILEASTSLAEAIGALQASPLAHSDWEIEQWDPQMIGTAMQIAQKWKKK